MHDLTEEEKRVAERQVQAFLQIMENRYGLRTDEAIALVAWARSKREMAEQIKRTSMTSLIGLLLSALAIVAWEGLRAILGKD